MDIKKKKNDGRVEYGQTKTISVLLIRGYIYIYILSLIVEELQFDFERKFENELFLYHHYYFDPTGILSSKLREQNYLFIVINANK